MAITAAFALPGDAASDATSTYLFMRLESPAPQQVPLSVDANAAAIVTLNGRRLWATEVATPLGGDTVVATLRPGGNDLWVRGAASPGRIAMRTRAIELLLADASQVRIPLSGIDERVPQDVSPMPAGLVQTADEMRDIVAYLMQSADY